MEELTTTFKCSILHLEVIWVYDAKVKFVPVYADTAYQLSADLLRQHWQANTRAILIASPSNPTGTIIQATELKKCIDFVNEQQGLFFSDEIYHGLVYEQGVASALEFSDQVFVINRLKSGKRSLSGVMIFSPW